MALRLQFEHNKVYKTECKILAELETYFGAYFRFGQPKRFYTDDTTLTVVYEDIATEWSILYRVQDVCRSLTGHSFLVTVFNHMADDFYEQYSSGVHDIIHAPQTQHAIQASFCDEKNLHALKNALQERYPGSFDYDAPVEVDEKGWHHVVWNAQDIDPYFERGLEKMRDAHPDIDFNIMLK